MRFLACLILTLFAIPVFAAIPPIGTFEWVSTELTPGELVTPEVVGYTVQREFNADLSYNEYRSGTLYRSGQYDVEDVTFQGMTIPALHIYCGANPVETAAYYPTGNGLEFYWGHDNGGWPYLPYEILESRAPVAIGNSSWGSVKSLFR